MNEELGAQPRPGDDQVDWKLVVLQIVRKMAETGIGFKIVGGASIALQKVPVPVKDVDIETTLQDAQQINALFRSACLLPLAWKEGKSYRSYFARFDFNGVQVEVMAQLERCTGQHWTPTMTTGITTVSLDDTEIRVSWLEEEFLVAIRRGRLARAATILPYCEQARLLALLQGKITTNVI